jgi:hypothetical protein
MSISGQQAMIPPQPRSRQLDGLAMAFSSLCALHCLAIPVMLTFTPMLADSIWTHNHFHHWLLLLIIPVSVVALRQGFRRHRNRAAFAPAIIGMLLLCLGAAFGVENLGALGERVVTTCGGAFIALAHWRNFRLTQQASCVVAPTEGNPVG